MIHHLGYEWLIHHWIQEAFIAWYPLYKYNTMWSMNECDLVYVGVVLVLCIDSYIDFNQ